MRTSEIKAFRLVGALYLFLAMTVTVNAQKLPDIQKSGLRAPANLNIDGKATEWNNTFQAFNKNIDVFYTISNDDDNLYIAIQATNNKVIYKITNGGITVTINPLGRKNEEKSKSIKYPLFNTRNLPVIVLEDRPIVTKDSTISSKDIGLFVNVINKEFFDKSKEVVISGIIGVSDTISVYNDKGIKVMHRFDYNMAYNYELAIPLKYLELTLDNPQFSYNIKVNGLFSVLPPNAKIIGEISPAAMSALEDSDFWGEYTLVK